MEKKISIITVCFNSEKTIRNTIESVISQTYGNIEYIIVDGNSSDKTLLVIKESLKGYPCKVISEPDEGLYDAMNKGISAATGDIIGFLNSDDVYINNKVIETLNNLFTMNNVDCLYADLFYVSQNNLNKIVRIWKTNKMPQEGFKSGWHPAHPTFFVKAEIYEKYGNFNIHFKLAADFELMLRFLEKYKISSFYYSQPIIKMRLGGETNKNLKNIYKQNVECIKAFHENGIEINKFYILKRLIPKLKQLV